MAKTVDAFSTIEELRLKHNEVAVDLGDIGGLNTPRQDNLVSALNSVNEKDFFFQEFVFVVSTQGDDDFSGNDNQGNLLKFRKDRIQVFVRGEHLLEGVDYSVVNQNSDGTYSQVNLIGNYADGGSSETNVNDRVVVYSYTGSYLGVAVQSTGSTFWLLDDSNAIYNNNASGVILNGDNTSITTDIESGFTLQLAGRTYAEDDITLATGKTLTAPTVTDGTASLSSGSLTSAVNGTFSGTVQAEQLTSTDDASIAGQITVGGGFGSTGVTISDAGNIDANGTLNIDGATTLNSSLDVDGATTLNGNVTLGNATSDTLSFTGRVNSDILPSTTNTRDLGSSSLKFAQVHSTNFYGELTGNSSTATTLETSRTIGGVGFDGSANIDLPGVNTSGNQDTSGNAATATALQNTRTINGVSFNGTANISFDTDSVSEGSTNQYFTNARVDARMSGKDLNFFDDVNYTDPPEAGQILVWDGTNNYWEPADQEDTDSIAEGANNLYYTDVRVSTRVDTILNHSNHSNITASKVGNEIRLSAAAQYGDSDVQSYLSGGAGLALSGSGSFSVNTSNGVKIDGDDVELDYEVISASDLGGSAPSGTGDAIGHLYFVI